MKTLKQLLLIFFGVLGIHQVTQDLFSWIDPEFKLVRDSGYFSAIAFLLLWVTVKYFKQRDASQPDEPKLNQTN